MSCSVRAFLAISGAWLNGRRHYRCFRPHIGILTPMPQEMIHQDQRQHGLGDGSGADPDTGIMAASCNDFFRLALQIDRLAWQTDTGRWFKRQAYQNILAG